MGWLALSDKTQNTSDFCQDNKRFHSDHLNPTNPNLDSSEHFRMENKCPVGVTIIWINMRKVWLTMNRKIFNSICKALCF